QLNEGFHGHGADADALLLQMRCHMSGGRWPQRVPGTAELGQSEHPDPGIRMFEKLAGPFNIRFRQRLRLSQLRVFREFLRSRILLIPVHAVRRRRGWRYHRFANRDIQHRSPQSRGDHESKGQPAATCEHDESPRDESREVIEPYPREKCMSASILTST